VFNTKCGFQKCTVFWDVTSCRPVKVHQRFGETLQPDLQDLKVRKARDQQRASDKLWLFAWLITRSKTQTVHFPETSVDFYQPKQRHIPHYSILHIHRFLNLKFNVFLRSFYLKVIYAVYFITKSLSLQLTK
jgi:hypothetical protein